MSEAKPLITSKVPVDWIDYNGHMNDADYVRAFSIGVDEFMSVIGLDEEARRKHQYTMYTLENHVCYLDEMHHEEAYEVKMYILDYDAKRVHAFLELYGENGKRAATSEQMLMGMDQSEGRPAPFPEAVSAQLKVFAEYHTPSEAPEEAGRVIGIRRKK
ncbi:3-hydroxyacyl-CoA dehydrogenase [Salimicrobium jeotgali]|uniref:3-hydroxyacyl-CoA dehydrogenase n=1 Tax=Salimicrobium jeotgali TaxID=1230341 RepID=K2GBB8_9BACI|nr:thioesterase family protein [Salimicrobium jeotgali]AKG05256.1 3-hydroxyacyl-CoA dehydrogenase [Salimicrobium jeotgali]EKE32358.1 hypothetical protein MJ3_02927 [Salimicrobium jeotgali]MBM7695668.1 acyl-CoA thioester hydrolase [Salimicrobium jeotgali]